MGRVQDWEQDQQFLAPINLNIEGLQSHFDVDVDSQVDDQFHYHVRLLFFHGQQAPYHGQWRQSPHDQVLNQMGKQLVDVDQSGQRHIFLQAVVLRRVEHDG